MVDNLPSAWPNDTLGKTKYEEGFAVGYIDRYQRTYIYNHFDLKIKIHESEIRKGSFRIVGFEVTPRSILKAHTNGSYGPGCHRYANQQEETNNS